MKKTILRSFHQVLRFTLPLVPVPLPEVISGEGAIAKLPGIIKKRGLDNLLVVTDQVLMDIGLPKGMLKTLDENGIRYKVFSDVQPNPSIQNIEDGYKFYKENSCRGIIAFGGGSPMDCAKMIGARCARPRTSVRMMKGLFRVLLKTPPFFAFPTTAGSGSETTMAAVVSDPSTHEKFAVVDFRLVPDYAFLDPVLTRDLPPPITAATGMDALTHAVESYIGLCDARFAMEAAEKAARLIFDNLERVYKDGSDMEARNSMALASFHAGSAFTRVFVGYVHAIAHNMGGLYGVPHGLANAVILPYVLDASRKDAEKKLARLAVACGIGEGGESEEVLSRKLIARIKEMNRNMGIPESIKELRREDIPLLAKRALDEATPMYPVPMIMNQQECEALIEKMLP